jgi:hypothetical protein
MQLALMAQQAENTRIEVVKAQVEWLEIGDAS